MIKFTLFFVTTFFMVTGTAQAIELSVGTYESSGWSHYVDGRVSIDRWADRFIMRAKLKRDGREYDTVLNLEPEGDGWYYGTGFIYVRYSENSGCRHRFAGKIYTRGESIFLRENTPKYIPYNPNGVCTAAGPYEWFNHPDPYGLVD